MGDQVDGLIVLFDLEHVGMHHLWKPGKFIVPRLYYCVYSYCLVEARAVFITKTKMKTKIMTIRFMITRNFKLKKNKN